MCENPETDITSVTLWLIAVALVHFSSKIFQDTTSYACLSVCAPVYLSAGGRESITAAEIIPAGDLSPLMTRLLRHLSFLPLTHSIHPSALPLPPPLPILLLFSCALCLPPTVCLVPRRCNECLIIKGCNEKEGR